MKFSFCNKYSFTQVCSFFITIISDTHVFQRDFVRFVHKFRHWGIHEDFDQMFDVLDFSIFVQVFSKLEGSFLRLFRTDEPPKGKHRTTHGNRFLKQTCAKCWALFLGGDCFANSSTSRHVGNQMQIDWNGAGTLSENCHVFGIAAEFGDIFLNPREGELLVFESAISLDPRVVYVDEALKKVKLYIFSFWGWRNFSKFTQNSQSVIECHENDVFIDDEIRTESITVPCSFYESPTVDPNLWCKIQIDVRRIIWKSRSKLFFTYHNRF